MVSNALASLDLWLARAEAVLAEQRAHALSPSQGLLNDDGQNEWTITLAALFDGLAELLESICGKPGRWILILEDERRRHLFWQALAFEDGSLCTEVVSNTYLNGNDRWTTEQERRLVALGWDPPNLPRSPNFIHVENTTSPEIEIEARRALTTIGQLFELDDADKVHVKLFSSSIRGDTPATPIYEQDQAS